jgi:hypothetical protein
LGNRYVVLDPTYHTGEYLTGVTFDNSFTHVLARTTY